TRQQFSLSILRHDFFGFFGAPPKGQPLAPHPPPPSRPISADWAAVPPEAHGSLAVVPLIPDKRYYGETTAGPARATGAVSEGIAGGLMIVIWQPQHKGFSASHWDPGTSVVDDARRLDGAKSLLGIQIHISGSNRVRSPWCGGSAAV